MIFLLIRCILGHCRLKVSLADIIRTQYSDQVSIERLVVRRSSLCGHSVSQSVIVRLCVSGSLWRTSSLEKFASYWNGFLPYPIMPRLTKWVIRSPFSQTFLTLFVVCFFVSLLSKNACCFVLSALHCWLTALLSFFHLFHCCRWCSCSLCSATRTGPFPLRLFSLFTWRERIPCQWVSSVICQNPSTAAALCSRS